LESAKDKKVSLEKGLAKVSRDKSWQLEKLSKKMLLPALCNILATADSTALVRTTAFLSTNGNSMSANNNFKVEFAEIAGRMKRCLVEAMIEQKLGSDGVRCWRILEARGKLDEKHVSSASSLTVSH
jgi:DNA-directed RNA polymerase III subunit RPC3